MDHQIGKQEKDQFIIILFVLLGLSLLLAVASATMWQRAITKGLTFWLSRSTRLTAGKASRKPEHERAMLLKG